MKGDFSRITFEPDKHYLRVLMQQGRVQLDADWNEQTDLLLNYVQNLAADLIGPHGGPHGNTGFKIILNPEDPLQLDPDEKNRLTNLGILPLEEGDFLIGKGHYYVKGLLCINEEYSSYFSQAVSTSVNISEDPSPFLFYLDAWERHITVNENEHIRELALGGADTTTRSQVVCQVKIKHLENTALDCKNYSEFLEEIKNIIKPGNGKLLARIQPPDQSIEDDACLISPDAGFRGAENQLYRVEIHHPRLPNDDNTGYTDASFKWSRENGSVIFPIADLAFSGEGNATITTVTLQHLGRDDRFSLTVGDWVEIVDDDTVLEGRAEKLLQIIAIDPVLKQVILEGKPETNVGQDKSKHPLMRRWDSPGAVPVEVPLTNDGWIPLEDGIQVKFEFTQDDILQTGDFWLIPARTETGNIIWPTKIEVVEGEEEIVPEALLVRGVQHFYAPLATLFIDQSGTPILGDCQCKFPNLCQLSDLFAQQQLNSGATDMVKEASVAKKPTTRRRKKT